MGVYIKGMEMPTNCSDCPLCYDMMECSVSDIRFFKVKEKVFDFCTERHPNCPLVPVPPHGRLIDADALIAKLNMMIAMAFGEGNTAFHFAYRSLGKVVENAPTIIEAEEGET